jgi:nucleotide-binding universal stress UspA family protein
MKILVPVDGSPASQRAVKVAIGLASEQKSASLVLLNVKNLPMLDLMARGSVMLAEWVNEEAERLGQEALREAIETCQAAHVRFTARIETGVPAPTVERIAAEEHIDHIVMGTRGVGGVRGLVLGSVSTQVLQLAIDVPITLVR